MSSAEARAYLESLPNFERATAGSGQSYGLERMRYLLAALDHPDHAMRIVHVAGTKGKGSTAAMIEAMLRAAGRRTGLYTSPHLVDFRERIAVAGRPIDEEAIGDLVLGLVRPAAEEVAARLGTAPLHFEQELALALLHFRRQGVQDAVVEVGLGGRLDATNAVDRTAISVITTIGHDHMQVLGYRLGEIAAEKAAIIRTGGTVVCAPQQPEALEVIRERCRDQGARLILAGTAADPRPADLDWTATVTESTLRGLRLTIRGPYGVYEGVWVALAGRHQATNAAVAVAAVHALWGQGSPPSESLAAGLGSVVWPGRLQVVGEEPLVLLDGAHNKESAEALAAALVELLPAGAPVTLLVNILRDKDLRAIIRPLVGGPMAARVRHVVVTSSSHTRAAPPAEVAAVVAAEGGPRAELIDDPWAGLARARTMTPPGGAVVVTGSLRLVGDILRCAQEGRQGTGSTADRG